MSGEEKAVLKLNHFNMGENLKLLAALAQKALEDRDEVTAKAILSWVTETKLLNPHHIFKQDFLESIVSSVFSDENISDFISELAFKYFAMADGPDHIDSLVLRLTDALVLDGTESTWSMLPEQLRAYSTMGVFEKQRSVGLLDRSIQLLSKLWSTQSDPRRTLFRFLRNNQWLVIVLLVYLTEVEDTPSSQSN